MSNANTDGIPRARTWQAAWIWARDNGQHRNVYALFRRTVANAHDARNAKVLVAADTRYQLFLNSERIGWGAPQSQPYFQYYDTHEVCLQPGENVLAVLVYHLGVHEQTRPGLILELLDEADQVLAATDERWKALVCDAWMRDTHYSGCNQVYPFQERFDARKFPHDWTQAGFDDSAWDPCRLLCQHTHDFWTVLQPRDIPKLVQQPRLASQVVQVDEALWLEARQRKDLSFCLSQSGRPLAMARVQGVENLLCEDGETTLVCSTEHEQRYFDGVYDPCILLDFGQGINAFPELRLRGPAGARVIMGYAERLVDGHFTNAIECPFADELVLDGQERTWRPASWRAFRYLKIRVSQGYQPLTILSIKADTVNYPFEEKGCFNSGDELLNSVFAISRATLKLCSYDCLTDTPWRESAQWLGDVAAVTVPGIYACYGDVTLPAKFYRQSAANQYCNGLIANVSNMVSNNWRKAIPDYSLWWLMGLWEHYLYTGEEVWLNRYYPEASRVIMTHLRYLNNLGLIVNMPGWVFVDWAPVDKRGACGAYNAIFAGALEAIIHIAEFKNDVWMQQTCEQVSTALRASFKATFFDEDKGVFMDCVDKGVRSQRISEHTNFGAIRWGLCDDEIARRVIDRFYGAQAMGWREYAEAQPFFMTVVLQALARMGRGDLAVELMRKRWGKRMVDEGCTSCHEEWGCNGSWRNGLDNYNGFFRTHSHAWSACPAEFLIKHLAGIEIIEPGGRKVKVNPVFKGVDYRVTYPLVAGSVEVSVANDKVKVATSGDVVVVP